MSFSLNIFVPPEEPVEAASDTFSFGNVAGSSKAEDRRAKQANKASDKQTPQKQQRSSKAPASSSAIRKNTDPKGRSVPVVPNAPIDADGAPKAVSKTEETVKTLLADTEKDEDKKSKDKDAVEGPESDKKHSRKNPEFRPRKLAGLSMIRQVRAAPAQESQAKESDHIFAADEFKGLGLVSDLSEHVLQSKDEKGMGLTKPTRVQARTVPVLLQGKDCMVKSETGSGKTLAYVLPILNSLLGNEKRVSREDGLYVLILSPTRELCQQIFDVLTLASRPFHWIISTCIVGGEKKKSEKQRLRKGVNIIVATPGRFADHLRTTQSLRDSLTANPLRWLILDEADRLLDSGFEKQVQEIIDTLTQLRKEGNYEESPTQTVLLSATITAQVEKLAGLALKNPEKILVEREEKKETVVEENGSGERRIVEVEHQPEQQTNFVMPKQLVQHYVLVEANERLVALAAYIRRHVRRTGNTCKTLVFVSSRAVAEFLHAIFSGSTWPPVEPSESNSKSKKKKVVKTDTAQEEEADANKEDSKNADEAIVEGLGTKWYLLHGSVDQKDRKRTIRDFGTAKGGVLICTDVAARGLDLPQVDLVVQYDPPSEVSEYVHRAGRTARSGRRGMAILFLREAELQYLEVLKTHGLELSPVKLTYDSLLLPPIMDPATGKRKANQPELAVDPEICRARLQSAFESRVAQDAELAESARKAYLSWVGAYAVHSSETKHIFVTRELHFGHVARSFALKDPPTKIKHHLDEAAAKKAKRKEIEDRRKKTKKGEEEYDDDKTGSAKKKKRSREPDDPASLMRKKARNVVMSMKSEFEA